MVAKPSVSVFQNFLRIENQLNIKKITPIREVVRMCQAIALIKWIIIQ